MTGNVNPVHIKANLNHMRAVFQGRVIADTNHALTVLEGDYPPAHYFPREDVDMSCLSQTDRRTRCPYKGEAAYFTVSVDDQTAENAAWSYESTLHDALALRNYIAFYPDRIQVSPVSPGEEASEPRSALPY